jgi:hypothetical protein
MRYRVWTARNKNGTICIYTGSVEPHDTLGHWENGCSIIKDLPPFLHEVLKNAMKGKLWRKSLLELNPVTWFPKDIKIALRQENDPEYSKYYKLCKGAKK